MEDVRKRAQNVNHLGWEDTVLILASSVHHQHFILLPVYLVNQL